MRLRLVWWMMVVCVLGTGGCFLQNERTSIRYYSIDGVLSNVPRARRSFPVVLGVRPFVAGTRYRENMLYRLSDVEVGFYPFDRWVEPPEEMVNRTIQEFLIVSGIFQQVTIADDVRPGAWILSGEVSRFDELRTAEGRVAVCWVRFDLRRARDEFLLWSEILMASVPLQTSTPEGLATAMSVAVDSVGRQLLARLEQADLRP